MKNRAFFTALTLFISFVLSVFFAEFMASLWVARGSTSTFCENVDTAPFANSRGFSLEHAFYQPLSSVNHCQPEYSYTYHIDSNGFRRHKFGIGKPTILAIGDSFTFGFGVNDDENFPALIGAYNAGMWGNPFDIQYKSFIRNVELVNPSVVVWGIYPPHVVTMMPGEWSKNIPGDRNIFISNSKFLTKILHSMPLQRIGESSLIKLVFNLFNIRDIFFDGSNLVLRRDGYRTKEAIIFDKNIYKTEYTDSEVVNATFGKDRDMVLLKMTEYFKGAKQIADSKNVKIIFMIIPSRLNLRLHDETVSIVSYKDALFDATLPAKLVSDSIRGAGFSNNEILDLGKLSEFKSGGWEKYYFKIDAHWNSKGHNLVARALKEKLGIPKDPSQQ